MILLNYRFEIWNIFSVVHVGIPFTHTVDSLGADVVITPTMARHIPVPFRRKRPAHLALHSTHAPAYAMTILSGNRHLVAEIAGKRQSEGVGISTPTGRGRRQG